MHIVKTVAAVLSAVALASPAFANEASQTADDQTPVKTESAAASEPAASASADETKKPLTSAPADERQTAEGQDSAKPSQS